MTTASKTALEGLIENFCKAWGAILSRAIGTQCEAWTVAENSPLTAPAAIITLQVDGSLSGQAAIMLDQRNAATLESRIGGNGGAKAQAIQDLLRQAATFAVNETQREFGPTRAQVSPGTPSWQPASVLTVLAKNVTAEPLRLHFLLSQEIAAPGAQSANSQPTILAPSTPTGSAEMQRRNLNLVMGVELEVTLRFGQKKLPLKQLLDLNAGSVVELDKRVQEPVDLLLREKVFARGEVVIVEGHYGLRITEVCAIPTQDML